MAVKNIAALDHINILTNDVEKCRNFYVDGLGFEEGFRPPFNIPGMWLYLDEHPVVHIIETEDTVEKLMDLYRDVGMSPSDFI